LNDTLKLERDKLSIEFENVSEVFEDLENNSASNHSDM
jgi:hypothetical protein